ncbi:histidine kinase [Litoribacter ruber]|uniref:sensor histidine kinase n=1 Tax=Litoribacter ruber TaxID=702568 RepID=UPI001BD97233|nr:histidine kinase [Litoribacter ruber]MBT0811869.1 histidine kinase [Litoribacter ruber]
MMMRLMPKDWGGWLTFSGFLILTWAGLAYLLQFYGLDWKFAIYDVLLHLALLAVSTIVLENIFRFYRPQQGNKWLVIVIPLVLGVVGLFFGTWVLKWVFQNEDARQFWEFILPVRGLVMLVVLIFLSRMLIMGGRIMEQQALQEHETWLEKTAKEAELYHLRQQLQPHFLFNSLNSINAMLKSQPEKARAMILQLSDFLRQTVKKDHKLWGTIEEEMAYLQQYLEIEKVRFGHRLSVQVKVDPAAKDTQLPQLLVQPLIENAVKHGLYGMVEEVAIEVTANREGHYLAISVSNPFDSSQKNGKGTGFGLEGLKRRMFLIFGRHDLLQTQIAGDNFIVTLKIPQP